MKSTWLSTIFSLGGNTHETSWGLNILLYFIYKHKTVNMGGITELLMSGPGQETGSKFPTGFQESDLALGLS